MFFPHRMGPLVSSWLLLSYSSHSSSFKLFSCSTCLRVLFLPPRRLDHFFLQVLRPSTTSMSVVGPNSGSGAPRKPIGGVGATPPDSKFAIQRKKMLAQLEAVCTRYTT